MGLHVQKAANILSAGGVIAYPTEAVWGLGCDPMDEAAVYRILSLKSRPVEKGLILITGQIEHFSEVLEDIPKEKADLLRASWPGPVTWLVKDLWHVPEWVRGNFSSIALRVTDHPLVSAITKQFGGPIISTSANPASKPEARTSLKVRQYFGDGVDYIVPGKLGGLGKPSQIIDLESQKVIRS